MLQQAVRVVTTARLAVEQNILQNNSEASFSYHSLSYKVRMSENLYYQLHN